MTVEAIEHLAGYARRMVLKKGQYAETHRHLTDHWTVVEDGEILVWRGATVDCFVAPAAVLIKAGIAHRLEAVRDSTCLCMHVFPMGSAEAEMLAAQVDEVVIKD